MEIFIADDCIGYLYIDSGLPSYARCYKISAVINVESALSEATCNDNCPFFMLPNVHTGNTDGFNDTFNANFDDEVVANRKKLLYDAHALWNR